MRRHFRLTLAVAAGAVALPAAVVAQDGRAVTGRVDDHVEVASGGEGTTFGSE